MSVYRDDVEQMKEAIKKELKQELEKQLTSQLEAELDRSAFKRVLSNSIVGVVVGAIGALGMWSFAMDKASEKAKDVAEQKATEVAKVVAEDAAKVGAKEVVDRVFASAVETARDTAGKAAELAVRDQVSDRARAAAEEATRDILQKKVGQDVVEKLQQNADRCEAAIARIEKAEAHLNRDTLAGLAQIQDQLSQQIRLLAQCFDSMDVVINDALDGKARSSKHTTRMAESQNRYSKVLETTDAYQKARARLSVQSSDADRSPQRSP